METGTETESPPDMMAMATQLQDAGVRKDGGAAKEKVEEAPAASATNPPGTTPPAKPTAEVRDMTGIPPEHHERLNRMTLEGFKRYSEIERKLAGGKLITSEDVDARLAAAQLAEHPRGFIASPEFEKASTALAEHSEVLSALETALISAMDGKNFKFLKRDDKGKLVSSGEYPPSAANRVFLQQMLTRASARAGELENVLTKIETDHKAANGARGNDVVAVDKQFFGHLEGNATFTKLADEAFATLPPSMKHNPLAKSYAKALAFAQGLMMEVDRLKKLGNTTAAQAGATPPNHVGANGDSESARKAAALARNGVLLGIPEAN